jgi:S1-C subfamily serine protease
MFVNAYAEAEKFTRPIVISTLRVSGEVRTGMGAFVVLNADGWIATAGHIIQEFRKGQADEPLVAGYDQRLEDIENSPWSPAKKKNERIRVVRNNDWVRKQSMWWANDQAEAVEAFVYPDADLAVCRLEPFDPTGITGYPTFKLPGNLRPGTGLVKVGFPFHKIDATYTGGNFHLSPGSLPAPLFPMDGIFTRNLEGGQSVDGYPLRFVETSSPGLRGQSGGPTLDRDGVVWAIQSQTQSLPLGFRPTWKDENGKDIEEHQVLNLGVGVHPETLQALFARHGVTVAWTP